MTDHCDARTARPSARITIVAIYPPHATTVHIRVQAPPDGPLTLEVLEGNKVAQAAYRASGFAGYELDPEVGRAMFWQKKL